MDREAHRAAREQDDARPAAARTLGLPEVEVRWTQDVLVVRTLDLRSHWVHLADLLGDCDLDEMRRNAACLLAAADAIQRGRPGRALAAEVVHSERVWKFQARWRQATGRSIPYREAEDLILAGLANEEVRE